MNTEWFTENMFLVKIQTNVNQRNHIHESFLSEVSHTINIRNFARQTWSDFVLYKNLVFFSKLNRFLDFGYLSDKSQPVSSLITMFLYEGVYCNICFLSCVHVKIFGYLIKMMGCPSAKIQYLDYIKSILV